MTARCMSALRSKVDILIIPRDVRYVPKGDIALIDCVKLKPSQSVSVVTGHPMPLFPLKEVPQSL